MNWIVRGRPRVEPRAADLVLERGQHRRRPSYIADVVECPLHSPLHHVLRAEDDDSSVGF